MISYVKNPAGVLRQDFGYSESAYYSGVKDYAGIKAPPLLRLLPFSVHAYMLICVYMDCLEIIYVDCLEIICVNTK
jgi:hypothetical protein